MVLLQRKLYFAKDPEGSNIIFQGGVQLFPGGGGGPNANFYNNPYNLGFSRGWSEPPPLWIGRWTHITPLLICILLAYRRVVRQKPWARPQHSLSLLRYCLLSRQHTFRFKHGKTVTVPKLQRLGVQCGNLKCWSRKKHSSNIYQSQDTVVGHRRPASETALQCCFLAGLFGCKQNLHAKDRCQMFNSGQAAGFSTFHQQNAAW